MDPAELKKLLKEAKEALKKNDPPAAARACKAIIKKEPDHYQANLLFGTACREQGKYQQSLEAYKKATQIDVNQVYAWQGIISVYDKQNIKSHNDLLDAYKRVATHFEKDDKQKYVENTIKLANILISNQESSKALKVMGRLAKSVGMSLEIAQILVQLLNLTTSEFRSKEDDTLYTQALEVLVDNTPQPAEETYRKLFSQYYRNKQYPELAKRCISMQAQWNHYFSPMEWLCRLYLESEVDPTLIESTGGIEKITEKLFKLHPASRYGFFARGKYLIEGKFKYVEGFSWINNALESSYNLHAALALIQGKLKFGDYEGGLEEASKAIANCTGEGKFHKNFKTTFELLYLEGLIGANETEKAGVQRYTLSLHFKNKEEDPNYPKFLDLSIRTALKKKYLSELENILKVYDEASSSALTGIPLWRQDFYRAIKSAMDSKEKFSTFVKSCVETHEHLPEFLLSAGIFLYDKGEYELAAELLQDLAKTDEGRVHPHTWKYLGLLAYQDEDSSAIKYLKKSYDLNLDSEVGALLSDLYHKQGEFTLKKNLLLDASKKVRKTKSKWVWARLGLLYLEEGNLIEAVECLQSAIRVDLEDADLWEALADAYFYRGSLQAAMRCYNKAIELGNDPVYPNMRISAIYHEMDEEDKALQGIKTLLEENNEDSSLHLEYARLCCLVAGAKIKENFDADGIRATEVGLSSAVKSILFGKDTSTVTLLPWILIGEFSLLLGELPSKTELQIPVYLLKGDADIGIEVLLKLEKVKLPQFKEIGTKALLQCLQIVSSRTSKINSEESKNLLGYLHHQIALTFYKRSLNNEDPSGKKQCLLQGIQYGKKAIVYSRNNPLYWNTIGVIAFHLSDMPLAQNCYIRALKADGNNVEAWSNLGLLYYQVGSYMLAHKMFARGQSVTPIYANSWIGQALVAEKVKPLEAPDLFRHACLLRHHPFAITSYGNSICKFLLEDEKMKKDLNSDDQEDYQYWKWHLLVKLDAVTHLNDLITRIEGREASPQLLNLKGIVSGWNGFYETSLESFTNALNLVSEGKENTSEIPEKERLLIHSNQVSALISMKKYQEAYQELLKFPGFDEIGYANAAIALFKLGDYQNAMQMYDKICQIPKLSPEKMVDAKIAMAVLFHLTSGVNNAKSMLFAPDMITNPKALATLGAIAVAQNDRELLLGVLQELTPFRTLPTSAQDIAFLSICREILGNTPEKALKTVLQSIHMFPTNPKLYAMACQVVIRYNLSTCSISIPRHLALCTLKMSRYVSSSREDVLFASKHSGVAALTHLIEYDEHKAISSSLKAIRCYPEQRDNWAVLACAYWVRYTKASQVQFFKNAVTILEREINLALCSEKILTWMKDFRVEIAKYGLQ